MTGKDSSSTLGEPQGLSLLEKKEKKIIFLILYILRFYSVTVTCSLSHWVVDTHNDNEDEGSNGLIMHS